MGVKLIKIGIIYLLIGMGMGVYMGATKDFSVRPVHAHVNLLGWTLLGISGLILFVNGNVAVDPILGLGSVLITVSAAVFAWLLLTKLPNAKGVAS